MGLPIYCKQLSSREKKTEETRSLQDLSAIARQQRSTTRAGFSHDRIEQGRAGHPFRADANLRKRLN